MRTGYGDTPSPRVKHSIARIKTMMNRINPEMLDTLSYSVTARAIAELQGVLRDYILPRDVLEAYNCHDGQDTFSVSRSGANEEVEGNTGFIYGLWWMSAEEVLEEYTIWRRLDISSPPSPVAQKKSGLLPADKKGKGRQYAHTAKAPSTDAFLFGSEMDPRTVRGRMRSCPRNYVREEYSHPSWLPILKDGYGNYIGVDLDPPPFSEQDLAEGSPRILPGRGQVIAFGREIDTKTILWNGWADQSEHDANVGGGWARFLSSFADDLSASTSLGNTSSRYDSKNSYSNNDEDEDENAYRSSSGGRQEAGSLSRNSAGLEWIDSSPIYSGLGTIEALVERSKRHWASVGLYEPESAEDTDDGNGSVSLGSVSGSLDRPDKPAPLRMPGPRQNEAKTCSPPRSRSSAGLGANDPSSGFAGDTSAPSTEFRGDLLRSWSASQSLDPLDVDQPGPILANNAEKPSTSPEPSLVLSPPSPKGNSATFQPFPPSPPGSATNQNSVQNSPTPASRAGRYKSSLPSPTNGDSLQSPLRFSPGEAVRNAERQRSLSGMSNDSMFSSGRDRSSKKLFPPPPAAPLGLPTLEFGNGIWEYGDTSLDGDELNKGSFDVIVDKQ
ncbi:MAG: Cell wall assembly regulator [Cyphobasidiales sp. Tagirdzhanova-0007]|nr:MAG: Cell wall assembly regulator [Cyphobasidiales sp. Tagirdzhanova-0007]